MNKVIDISEAVKKYILPGITIQFGASYAFPNAFFREIIRQYKDRKPDFTVISSVAVSTNIAILVHEGLCKKIITSFAGDGCPYPSPNKVFQSAYKNKKVEFENWSMLTLTMRLVAGAMSLPFFPTNSILNSSMVDENSKNFSIIEEPFEKKKIGIIRSLNPDISVIHGFVSDEEGNVLITPPYALSFYGAMAAKKGVIATVEKIVNKNFIKKYSYLQKIPSHKIIAVCEAPFGAHPAGNHNYTIEELEGYSEDSKFYLDLRKACEKSSELDKWIKYWILDCKNNDDYLKRLGKEKLLHLRNKLKLDQLPEDIIKGNYSKGKRIDDYSLNNTEKMILMAVKKIVEVIEAKKYKTILAGIGASSLASWVSYYSLLKEGYEVDLMNEAGMYGYSPLLGDPFLFALRNLQTSKMQLDTLSIMGIFLNKCSALGVLGSAQIDKNGNINTTLIPEKSLFITGSGGGNDVVSSSEEIIVVMEQDKSRFSERLRYITSPGEKVTTVITQYGIYEKVYGKGELILTGVPGDKSIKDMLCRMARENCGWDLKIAEKVKMLPDPSRYEIELMRSFDPEGYFLGNDA